MIQSEKNRLFISCLMYLGLDHSLVPGDFIDRQLCPALKRLKEVKQVFSTDFNRVNYIKLIVMLVVVNNLEINGVWDDELDDALDQIEGLAGCADTEAKTKEMKPLSEGNKPYAQPPAGLPSGPLYVRRDDSTESGTRRPSGRRGYGRLVSAREHFASNKPADAPVQSSAEPSGNRLVSFLGRLKFWKR